MSLNELGFVLDGGKYFGQDVLLFVIPWATQQNEAVSIKKL